MSDKFKNKYRISSIRLQSWDYGSNGSYFITICTKNREHFFGEIVDGEMHLNDSGKLVEQFWMYIPKQFPFIELGNFVIMPNHVHGILIIDKNANFPQPPIKNSGGITGIKNPMFHENISRIIRWYKGRCSFEIRKSVSYFEWQSRFHDHIIRDAKSFDTIQNYIANNPINWGKDKFHDR